MSVLLSSQGFVPDESLTPHPYWCSAVSVRRARFDCPRGLYDVGLAQDWNLHDACTACIACRDDLAKAKASIEELFGKIGEIRRKADQSERLVQVSARSCV